MQGANGRRRMLAMLAAGVALAAVATHARAIGVGFFSDDYQWLARMPATLRHPTFLFTVFGRDFNPLLHASFALDWAIAGADPRVFHATSLLVHAACGAMLVAACSRLGAPPLVAAAAAVTWALNVRLSEAVIWPAARGHALATLLVLAAVVALAGSGRRRAWWGALWFALALLAKETAIAPLALSPWLLLRGRGSEPGGGRGAALRRAAVEAAPLVAVGAAFAAFHVLAKPAQVFEEHGAADIVLELPFLLLRPMGLGDAYPFTAWAFVLVMGALAAAAVALRRTAAPFGLAWMLACALVVAPLEKTPSRYLLMLAVGQSFALCGLVAALAPRLRAPAVRRGALAGAVVLLAAWAIASVLDVQREIDDHAALAEPYARCLDALREPALAIPPGGSLRVVDASSRTTVAEMTRESWERGGMVKLIPRRPGAIAELVELHDAVNVVRAGRPGGWAVPVDVAGVGGDAVFRVVEGTTGQWVSAPIEPVGAAAGPCCAVRLVGYDEFRAVQAAPLPR